MTFYEKLKKHEKVIGGISATLAIVMFIALIEVFISNMQGKSNIIIQPIATAFNGFFWCLYAICRKDWFLLAPNVLALFLGTITAAAVFL